MVEIPLVPAASAAQFASVPMPSDDTRPMPVTTTRRVLVMVSAWLPGRDPSALLLRFGVRLDVLDGFLDARDLLGVLVGDLDAELLFERHHELDGVERIGAQIVHKRGIRRHFLLIDSELLNDDALDVVG